MSLVEVMQYQGAVLLRARGSELIILPNHVHALQNAKEPKEFAKYFLNEALVNRPARKLFDSWLRKDTELWKRIFHMVHKDMEKVNLDENPIMKAMAQKDADKKTVSEPVANGQESKKETEKKPSSKKTATSKSELEVDTEKKKTSTKSTSSKEAADKDTSAKETTGKGTGKKAKV